MNEPTTTPAQRAGGVVFFGVIVGIVGGWLFTPIVLVVLPLLFFLAWRRYTRKDLEAYYRRQHNDR